MLYTYKFFKTEKSAKAFQQKHGGVLYSNLSDSQSCKDYCMEACAAGLTEAQRKSCPYCVVRNIVDGGPIQPDPPKEVRL